MQDDEELTPEERRDRKVREIFQNLGTGIQQAGQRGQEGAQLRAAQALQDYNALQAQMPAGAPDDQQTAARRRWWY